MFRKYVIVTLAAVFFLGASGCTSKKAEEDKADVESSSTDGMETAEATENNSDLDTSTAVADAPAEGDMTASTESSGGGGDDLGSAAATEAPPADQAAVAPGDITEAPPADIPPADTLAAAPDATTPAPSTDTAAPPATDTSIAAAEPAPETASNPVPEPGDVPKPVGGSLQKVKSTPEKHGKILANAVYVARAGDTKKSISQKVFGTDTRVKELCKVNSFNCSRKIKVGDKFYYNSPQRPTDETTIKTFYEDAGIQPEIYVTKAGDNIRKLGKQLLGHDRSWMELWATNEVESKGDLEEGVQLKYWPKSEVAAPALAQTDTAAPAAPTEAAPPVTEAPPAGELAPPATNELAANAPANPEAAANTQPPPPPPPQDMAANAPPPPPPPAEGGGDLTPSPDQAQAAAAGTVEPPPPPPPPPPANGGEGAVAGEEVAMGQDPSQTMALGIGAVLLLAAAGLLISIRKRKQRRAIDFNTGTQTQID